MLCGLQRYIKYFAILGLVPWSEKGAQQQVQKIYTMAIILLNNCMTFYVIVYAPPDVKILVSMLVSIIVFITQTVTMTVIELQVMCQYKRYYEFCLHLKCLKLRFQCELQQPIVDLPWTRYIKFFLLGILNVLTLVPSVLVVLYNDYVGHFLYSVPSLIIIRFQCLLLVIYAELLGYHVELLGERLQAVHKSRQLGTDSLCSLEHLLSLKRVYMELYHLFVQYNDLYGWSIVCIFVVMFLDSMINIYWAMQILNEVYEWPFLYLTCSSFLPLLILLFTFCRCGEYCKRQHILIGSHVRGLACASQRQAASPPLAYNAVLAEFAMQVEQDALIISAEGFMDIDYSLLMSIFTAMVTYLIILTQFGSLSA
ncbi:putative gustatory receptor 39b [Drosophila grimshawi]|uniref:putative gustatory receptor 39b n=1 Tax=Drosophila grimshawi TaxID=7222 RepID=UPI000C86E599|nr:putative gustatory receptor 39b [Drosophila grimshawi]